MNRGEFSLHCRKWAMGLIAGLLLLRCFSLGFYPLSDTTEARYGNIARLMVETGDWVTPWYSPNVPFWGKPPLSTWLSAAAMKCFGINEFSARIPSFLMALIVLALVHSLAAQRLGNDGGIAASLVLMGFPLFFVASGAVMTDPALMLATTLCMVAFWRAITATGLKKRLWGYAFFTGLAIGLLAKGPVAVVLTMLPVSAWVLLQGKWAEVRGLPWFSGTMVTLSLTLPWYLLAEHKTPGFLEYFLIGEHWKRFTVPGWKGDLYGNAHLQPKGTIWLYWLVCALPWSLILPAMLLQRILRKGKPASPSEMNGWTLYLVVWILAPMVFFTLAGNILWTYVLPGLPAFALLIAGRIGSGSKFPSSFFPVLCRISTGTLVFVAMALAWIILGHGPAEKSQKEVIAAFRSSGTEEKALTYLFKRPYSAQFYSRGRAGLVRDTEDLEPFFRNNVLDYFIVSKKDMARLSPAVIERINNLGLINQYYLLKEKSPVIRGDPGGISLKR